MEGKDAEFTPDPREELARLFAVLRERSEREAPAHDEAPPAADSACSPAAAPAPKPAPSGGSRECPPPASVQPAPPSPRAAPAARFHAPRLPILIGATVLGLGVMGAGVTFSVRSSPTPPAPTGVVNAPLLTIRAPADGRVESLSVGNGQFVEAGTVLFTIRSQPPPDPAIAELQSRLAQARTEAAAVATKLAGLAAAPSRSTAGDASLREQQRSALVQKQAESAHTLQLLEKALAEAQAAQPPTSVDPVRAIGPSLVWSLPVTAGNDVVAGVALAQLVDCTHLFLVATAPQGNAHPRPGQAVRILFPGSNMAAPGMVTASPEPGPAVIDGPGNLIVSATREALATASHSACPVGRRAELILPTKPRS